MSVVIAQLNRADLGGHFHGYGLRTEAELISPIIGVDHYWMDAPTFGPHQHAGISAVSYLLPDSETGMANRDSIGTQNVIQPGGLHWTTVAVAWCTRRSRPKPAKRFTDCRFSSLSLHRAGTSLRSR